MNLKDDDIYGCMEISEDIVRGLNYGVFRKHYGMDTSSNSQYVKYRKRGYSDTHAQIRVYLSNGVFRVVDGIIVHADRELVVGLRQRIEDSGIRTVLGTILFAIDYYLLLNQSQGNDHTQYYSDAKGVLEGLGKIIERVFL